MNAKFNFANDALGCESPHRQPNSCQRILLVKREGDLRQLNAEVLMDAGYQVDLADDGATAWAALQSYKYDLLITDQFLPRLSGVQLVRKICAASMSLPVIMATDILPTWEFALHPCLQAVTMLHNPYSTEKFLGLVKNVLVLNTRVDERILPLKRQTQPVVAVLLQ